MKKREHGGNNFKFDNLKYTASWREKTAIESCQIKRKKSRKLSPFIYKGRKSLQFFWKNHLGLLAEKEIIKLNFILGKKKTGKNLENETKRVFY